VQSDSSPQDVLLSLGRTIAGVQTACQERDSEYVRTAADGVLAALEPLRDKPDIPLQEWRADVPKDARSALWLVESSANSLLEKLTADPLDWGGIGAAASFTQSGVELLREALERADQP
jgi:hypothetical protein